MARTVAGFFDFQVNKMDMERIVLMNLAPDFFGIKNHCTTVHLVQNPLVLSCCGKIKNLLQNYAALKEIRLLGY